MSKAAVKPTPRGSLVSDLERAKAAFDQADARAQNANETRATALGRLNEAQRAVDTVMDELKADAPRDSDWRRMTKT
jgi:exonuclease VII small subunit